MTKLWFKELTGPENYKKKLFEFFFNTKKKMFPTDFSYQNQSHSLLIFWGVNMWPPFRASEGRLAQLMLTFGSTVMLLQDMNILAKVNHLKTVCITPHLHLAPSPHPKKLSFWNFCIRLARLCVEPLSKWFQVTGRGTRLGAKCQMSWHEKCHEMSNVMKCQMSCSVKCHVALSWSVKCLEVSNVMKRQCHEVSKVFKCQRSWNVNGRQMANVILWQMSIVLATFELFTTFDIFGAFFAIFLVTFGIFCHFLATFTIFWHLFGIFYNCWQFLPSFSNFCHLLATFAIFCLLLVIFHNFWHCLATFCNLW